jgi:hypothetical protein
VLRSALAAGAIITVLAGCGFELPRRTTVDDTRTPVATPGTGKTDAPQPVVEPELPDEGDVPPAPGDAEAADAADGQNKVTQDPIEVIQRRIAWRKTHAPGKRPPTPTPTPVIGRQILTGGIGSSADLGLMWLRSAAGGFSAEDAREYCEILWLGGLGDWRLPSIDELHGVAIAEREPGWSDGVRVLWSSTPHDPRGYDTIELPEIRRSSLEVGVAHAVCVRDVAPDEGS